jgi:hypothetical protein
VPLLLGEGTKAAFELPQQKPRNRDIRDNKDGRDLRT